MWSDERAGDADDQDAGIWLVWVFYSLDAQTIDRRVDRAVHIAGKFFRQFMQARQANQIGRRGRFLTIFVDAEDQNAAVGIGERNHLSPYSLLGGSSDIAPLVPTVRLAFRMRKGAFEFETRGFGGFGLYQCLDITPYDLAWLCILNAD